MKTRNKHDEFPPCPLSLYCNENREKHEIFESNLYFNRLFYRSEQGLNNYAVSRIVQFTWNFEPVYVEAIVSVNKYDFILDVLVVNQTDKTLQNCTLTLVTHGDLRVVESPAPIVLAPYDHTNIRVVIKVNERIDECSG